MLQNKQINKKILSALTVLLVLSFFVGIIGSFPKKASAAGTTFNVPTLKNPGDISTTVNTKFPAGVGLVCVNEDNSIHCEWNTLFGAKGEKDVAYEVTIIAYKFPNAGTFDRCNTIWPTGVLKTKIPEFYVASTPGTQLESCGWDPALYAKSYVMIDAIRAGVSGTAQSGTLTQDAPEDWKPTLDQVNANVTQLQKVSALPMINDTQLNQAKNYSKAAYSNIDILNDITVRESGKAWVAEGNNTIVEARNQTKKYMDVVQAKYEATTAGMGAGKTGKDLEEYVAKDKKVVAAQGAAQTTSETASDIAGKKEESWDDGVETWTCPDKIRELKITDPSYFSQPLTSSMCKFIDILIAPARYVAEKWLTMERMSKSFTVSPPADQKEGGAYVIALWTTIRDLINVLFLLAFMGMALMNVLNTLGIGSALGGKLDSWQVKKMIPAIIAAVVMVNFSLAISQFVLDLSNAIVSWIFPVDTGGAVGLTTLLNSSEGGFGKFMIIDKTGVGTAFIKMLAIYAYVGILFYTWLVMWVRTYVINILFIFSAVPYVGNILPIPIVQGLTGKWWGEFSKWVMMGPLVALFLYISAKAMEMMGKGADALIGTTGDEVTKPLAGVYNAADPSKNEYGLTQIIIAVVIIYIGLSQTMKASKEAAAIVDKGISKATGGKISGITDAGSKAWGATGGKRIEQLKSRAGSAVKTGFYAAAGSTGIGGRVLKGAMDYAKKEELKVEQAKGKAEDAMKGFEADQAKRPDIARLKLLSSAQAEEKAKDRAKGTSTAKVLDAIENGDTPWDQKQINIAMLQAQAKSGIEDAASGVSWSKAEQILKQMGLDPFSKVDGDKTFELINSGVIGGAALKTIDPKTRQPKRQGVSLGAAINKRVLEGPSSELNSIGGEGFDAKKFDKTLSTLDLDKVSSQQSKNITDKIAQLQGMETRSPGEQKALKSLQKFDKQISRTRMHSNVKRIESVLSNDMAMSEFNYDQGKFASDYKMKMNKIEKSQSADDVIGVAEDVFPDLLVGVDLANETERTAAVEKIKSYASSMDEILRLRDGNQKTRVQQDKWGTKEQQQEKWNNMFPPKKDKKNPTTTK